MRESPKSRHAKCTTQVHRTSTECQPHAHTTHTVIQVEIVQQTAETLRRITNEQYTKGVIIMLHSIHVITNIISVSKTSRRCHGRDHVAAAAAFRLLNCENLKNGRSHEVETYTIRINVSSSTKYQFLILSELPFNLGFAEISIINSLLMISPQAH